VYSFGVVLLELVTGRSPIDPRFGEGRDIVFWLSSKLASESLHDVLDPRASQGEGRHAQGAQDRRALHRKAAGGQADHEGRCEDAHRRRHGALQPARTAAVKGLQQQELLLNFWSRLCVSCHRTDTYASVSSLDSWCHLRYVVGQFVGSCTCRYFVQ
jgi:hypothetical protein